MQAAATIDALRDGRYTLIQHPIIDCRTGKLMFEEILLRLHDTQGNEMPVFESLMRLDRWQLLSEISPYLLQIQLAFSRNMQVPATINLPPSALATDDMRSRVLDILMHHTQEAGATHNVTLEITETAYLEPNAAVQAFMHEVSGHGYQWALDDFGDGYHTFGHITTLPLHMVKLAKEVSRLLLGSETPPPEVQEILRLARTRNLILVAEHVSTAKQAKSLYNKHKIEFAQVDRGQN